MPFKLTQNQWLLLGVALAGLLLIPKLAGSIASQAGKSAGEAAAGLVTGATEGVVYAVGDAVGIPHTNIDQCQSDIAAGNTVASSFSCPAGTFLKSLF